MNILSGFSTFTQRGEVYVRVFVSRRVALLCIGLVPTIGQGYEQYVCCLDRKTTSSIFQNYCLLFLHDFDITRIEEE